MSVLTAYATFLLARHVTGRSAESWLAGLLFAWSPAARHARHGPLQPRRRGAARDLPPRADEGRWTRALPRRGRARRRRRVGRDDRRVLRRVLPAHRSASSWSLASSPSTPARNQVAPAPFAGRLTCCCCAWPGSSAPSRSPGDGHRRSSDSSISARSLYTPVLVLTALALMRAAWHVRAAPRPGARNDVWRLRLSDDGVRARGDGAAFAGALRGRQENHVRAISHRRAVPWRSSPAGVDLLALVIPNPNHPSHAGLDRRLADVLPGRVSRERRLGPARRR